MKKLISIIVLLAMLSCTIIMAVPAAAKGPIFSDVKDGAWYAKAVNSLNGLGIVNGDRGKFYPEMNISRCEFAMILSSLAGADTSEYKAAPFSDVEAGKWYSGAIAWAYAEGIVKGKTPTSFAPKAPITREEICTMITRLIWKYGLAVDGMMVGFTDDADIHGWASESVYTCRLLGIVEGYKDGSFRPGNYTKRCEAAQIVYRLITKYGNKITGLSMEEALERATLSGGTGDAGFPVAAEGFAKRGQTYSVDQDTAPKHDKVYVISSKKEMSGYIESAKNHVYYLHGMDHGGWRHDPISGLTNVLLSYDEDFFREHDVVIVLTTEPSGSYNLKFDSIEFKNGKYVLSVNVSIPMTCSGDVAEWVIWAVVPKGSVDENNAVYIENKINIE